MCVCATYRPHAQLSTRQAQGKRICSNTGLFLGARASSPPRRNPAGKMPALPGEVSAGSEGVPALAEGKMPSLPG